MDTNKLFISRTHIWVLLYSVKYTGILKYWKSAGKYSIQAVTISMYMLINSSKNPQNYQRDQNIVPCFHTMFRKPADNLQYHKDFQFHNTKRIKRKLESVCSNLFVLYQDMQGFLACT